MTRDETKKLVMLIGGVYQNFKPTNLSFTIDVWNAVIGDFDYKVLENAFVEYAHDDTSGFAPTPGQLIHIAFKKNVKLKTAQEAWSLVQKAMSNSIYNSQEEFNKLPVNVQRAVGSASRLRELAMTENLNQQVEFSIFAKTYEEVVEESVNQMKIGLLEEMNNDTKRFPDNPENP